jgi:hypothetical protein
VVVTGMKNVKSNTFTAIRANICWFPTRPLRFVSTVRWFTYDTAVLKEIERRFFAIQSKIEQPDSYVEMPEKAYR